VDGHRSRRRVANDTDSGVGRIGSSESPIRFITGADNRRWTVREMTSNQYDRRDARDLVFMARDIVRRVRSYPRDWYLLDDEELYALSLSP
jgi:hypothetical protein